MKSGCQAKSTPPYRLGSSAKATPMQQNTLNVWTAATTMTSQLIPRGQRRDAQLPGASWAGWLLGDGLCPGAHLQELQGSVEQVTLELSKVREQTQEPLRALTLDPPSWLQTFLRENIRVHSDSPLKRPGKRNFTTKSVMHPVQAHSAVGSSVGTRWQ